MTLFELLEYDFGLGNPTGVFPGIADQVVERNAQQVRVGRHLHARSGAEIHCMVGILLAQLGNDRCRHLGHVDAGDLHLVACNA